MNPLRRLARGVRDTLRLLSPAVRAERAYSRERDAVLNATIGAAEAAGRAWPGPDDTWGCGLDERVVEYPWLFARLGAPAALLDVGSTLNHPEFLPRLTGRGVAVTFLNPFPDDGWRGSASDLVRYVTRDVREAGEDLGAFPVITCLSVLEHIGCSNERYGAPAGREADCAAARRAAMRAMRDRLARGGRLLLTVPFGRYEDHGWFVQLDAASLDDAMAAFGDARADVAYCVHEEGWRAVPREACAGVGYGERTRGASAVACVELTIA